MTTTIPPGDGFTTAELTTHTWYPQREYSPLRIDQLQPGPRAVTFEGRVVNLKMVSGRSARHPKAAGWHYLVVKDDSGCVFIKLYFAQSPYPLRLGQLVTIWTAFLSEASSYANSISSNNNNNNSDVQNNTASIPGAHLSANLFPTRVTSDHIMIHAATTTVAATSTTDSPTATICRTPLDYTPGQTLPGLMALDSYIRHGGGHDGVRGVKLLVCVGSIGARRKVAVARRDDDAGGSGRGRGGNGSGGGSSTAECEALDVFLFDHTSKVHLTLWNDLIDSVIGGQWEPWKTILLISDPGFVVGTGRFATTKGRLSIARTTMVEVEPVCADAEWLRGYAAELRKKEGLCLEVPEGVWDVEAAKYGVVRMLFTLAEIDKWVRSDAHQVFSGFISVVVMEMSLVTLQRRNMLMCGECCGVPVYSNSAHTPCRSCTHPIKMRPNPRIFGTLLDETGCIAAGKLLWSEPAWEDIFHRTTEEIAQVTAEEAALLEQRIVFMRMHLVVGWSEPVGRLAVLAMMA